MTLRILVRGGGDLASGVILRCVRAGWQVCVTELAQPLAVRRTVCFAQAVYDGIIEIEGVRGVRSSGIVDAVDTLAGPSVPVLIDPDCAIFSKFDPHVLVDARMTKKVEPGRVFAPPLTIGLGPGFTAGVNCDAVVETLRGHYLGRVIWQGSAAPNTGLPDKVGNVQDERVLRAPVDGVISSRVAIGEHVEAGQVVALVAEQGVASPIAGVLRGLVQDGVHIARGVKAGDVDPRDDPSVCHFVSDKALAVGGGVLEAILSWPALRAKLYGESFD